MFKVLILFFTLKAFAVEIPKQVLVAGPQMTDSEYSEVLGERRDLMSPMEEALRDHSNAKVRSQIFEAADQCLEEGKCAGFKDNFASLREKNILNEKELALLNELYTKAHKTPDCFWKSLTQTSAPECGLKKLDVSKIGIGVEDSYLILLDGRAFQKNQPVMLVPHKKYHWKIFSSRYLPKETWATIEEVESQLSLNTPYVTGGCLASTPAQNLETESLWVAFDKSCVRKVDSREAVFAGKQQQSSWISENKYWVVPVLVFAVGGAAYYLHDKVEFQSPF
jgi:hypothetical protein